MLEGFGHFGFKTLSSVWNFPGGSQNYHAFGIYYVIPLGIGSPSRFVTVWVERNYQIIDINLTKYRDKRDKSGKG